MRFAPFFVVTVAVGALVGWFAPEGAPPMPDDAGAQPAERLAVARSEPWLDGEVVLPRDRDGHFYAEASAGAGSVRMLVDTGASAVALTADDAATIGVDWRESDLQPVARGASGEVYGVPVTLERLEVGGIEARGVRAVVVPEGLDVSLLGQAFLAKVSRVEVARDRMVLHD